MRHRGGPTKRLAPSTRPESSCPHSYTEDEGLQLEIDCVNCAGAHDLSNCKCMVGVMNVVSSGAIPETVILRRFTHKRYRKDIVRVVATAATELAALNRALASTDQASDKGCRTCTSSKHLIISAMKLRLLENPRSYIIGGAAFLEELRLAHSKSSCPRSGECIEAGFAASALFGGRG